MYFFNQFKRLFGDVRKAILTIFFKTHPVIGVLAIFASLPFLALFCVWDLAAILFSIPFALLTTPFSRIHTFLKKERDENHVAVNCVLYFLSWGVVFFGYILNAVLTCMFYIAYFMTATLGYLASFGGIKFHIIPTDETILNTEDKKFGTVAIIGYTLAAIGLLLLLICLSVTTKHRDFIMFLGACLYLGYLIGFIYTRPVRSFKELKKIYTEKDVEEVE